MEAPRIAGRIVLQAVNEKWSVREELTSVLKAEHVVGPLHGTVDIAQIPAVLASGASYVNSSQIMGELDRQTVEATYGRGK
jgi:hypothetical protein